MDIKEIIKHHNFSSILLILNTTQINKHILYILINT